MEMLLMAVDGLEIVRMLQCWKSGERNRISQGNIFTLKYRHGMLGLLLKELAICEAQAILWGAGEDFQRQLVALKSLPMDAEWMGVIRCLCNPIALFHADSTAPVVLQPLAALIIEHFNIKKLSNALQSLVHCRGNYLSCPAADCLSMDPLIQPLAVLSVIIQPGSVIKPPQGAWPSSELSSQHDKGPV